MFTARNLSHIREIAGLVDDLRYELTRFAASAFELDMMGNDLETLRQSNVSNGGVDEPAMDEVFANGLPMGCKVVKLSNHTVSLYCFGNDKGQVVHCFVLPAEALTGELAEAFMKPVVRYTDRDTGGWIDGDYAYMLVSSMPGVNIKPFLLPAQEKYARILNSPTLLKTIAITLPYIE